MTTGARITKLSPRKRPDHLSLQEWQLALRRQAGHAASFHVQNLGTDPVLSDFQVTNPANGHAYRVAIRGGQPGQNFCACPDYAVNTLGTCKHIEFLLRRLGRRPGAKRRLAEGYHPCSSEIYVRYGLTREVVFRAGLECPPALKRQARRSFDRHGVLKPGASDGLDRVARHAKRLGHEVRIYPDAWVFVEQARRRARVIRRVDALFPHGAESPAFATLLKVPLYPYQRRGALFAAKASRNLIADDMGLGKTIQALAAAEILARAAGIQRVLVVAPTSLTHQWAQEVRRCTDRSVAVVEGPPAERARRLASGAFVTITSYPLVHRDFQAICTWEPDLIILDEAQRIKNWQTRTAQTVKQLPSTHAIVLTGTPLENRLEEVHSIVEFVDRFHLGPRFRFLAEHQQLDETGRVIGYKNLGAIAQTLRSVMIRRTRAEVQQDLPARLEKRIWLPMTEPQRVHHDEQRGIVARVVAKWRRLGLLPEKDQRRLMAALQTMRMLCTSTYLVDPATDHGAKVGEAVSLIRDVLAHPGAKLVVFSQWVRTHELLRKRLDGRMTECVLFHGGIPAHARGTVLARFKENPACRVLLATDAGGVGLNLQEATAVVIMDQPWNPAVLEQRIGRVHRMGQQRPVLVYHLIAEQSIEQSLLDLLAFKQSLFAGVLDGGQETIRLGGTRLSRFMRSVEQIMDTTPSLAPESGPPPGAGRTPADTPLDPPMAPASQASAAAPPGGDRSQAGWQEVLAAGRTLLDTLEAAVKEGTSLPAREQRASGHPTRAQTQDLQTGGTDVSLPAPIPELLTQLATLFSQAASLVHHRPTRQDRSPMSHDPPSGP